MRKIITEILKNIYRNTIEARIKIKIRSNEDLKYIGIKICDKKNNIRNYDIKNLWN